MTPVRWIHSILLAVAISVPTPSFADAPSRTIFVARALLAGSVPANGSYTVTAKVWTAATQGQLLYQETHSGVPVSDGGLQFILGSATPTVGTWGPGIFQAADNWLELTIGSDVMSPRLLFSSVPFALTTQTTNRVGQMTFDNIKASAPVGDKGPPGDDGPPGASNLAPTTTAVCSHFSNGICASVTPCSCASGHALISQVAGKCTVADSHHTGCSGGICCTGISGCNPLNTFREWCCLCED